MRKISNDKLKEILKQHQLWLDSKQKKGNRANLRDADLRDADLQDSDLRKANLQRANLQKANLQGANLQDAYLQDAYLQDANLQGADLRSAYLRGAYLRGADLRGADLDGANLRFSDLQFAIFDKNQKDYFNFSKTTIKNNKNLRQQAEENIKNKQRINELEKRIRKNKGDEEEKNKLKQKLGVAKKEIEKNEVLREEIEKLKKAKDTEQESALDKAIEHISTATGKTETMLEAYNKHSNFFIWVGGICYGVALIVAFYIYINIDPSLGAKNWHVFTPSVLLSFLGTALLRHDWKIRQLAGDLVAQQNTTDTATGILKAALTLKQIDDMPDSILEDSFNDVRSALLLGKKAKTDKKDEPIIDTSVAKVLTK